VNYNTNEFKGGLKILIDSQPCVILENEFVKPGKGQAFNRVKIRNLKTNKVMDRTYKSGESVPAADVVEQQMQFLYTDGSSWHFMDTASYEQFEVTKDVVRDSAKWLKEQDICTITLWNSVPLIVEPPNFVILQVTETDPGLKGDTSGGGIKPATLETGAIVRVPLFIQIDEMIKIDTRSGEYVARVKST